MNKKSNNIQKAIWETRLPAIQMAVVVLFLVFVAGGAILATKLPSGPSKEITVLVESIGVAHGATGNVTYLICDLGNGERARVFLDAPLPITIGTKIIINESPRFVGGSMYQFSRIYEPE